MFATPVGVANKNGNKKSKYKIIFVKQTFKPYVFAYPKGQQS